MRISRTAILVFFAVATTWGCTPTGSPDPSPSAAPPLLSPTPTETAAPVETIVSSPTTAATAEVTVECSAAFSPLGFSPDGSELIGKNFIDGLLEAELQTLDLAVLTARTFYRYDPSSADLPVLSPDGRLVAVPQEDFSVVLVRVADGGIETTLAGHTNFVTAIVFSAAGDRVYTGSMDTYVRVWDLAGALLADFQPDGADGFPSELTGLGLSPDGKLLATIPLEGWIKLWNTADLSKAGELEGPIFGSYNGSQAVFSPDGQYLAAGLAAGPGAVSLWRLSDQALLWRGGFFAFAFSPDGRFFAHTEPTESGGERVVLRSADGQTVLAVLPEEFPFAIWRLEFSSDSTLLALQSNFLTQVWDPAAGVKLLDFHPPCP